MSQYISLSFFSHEDKPDITSGTVFNSVFTEPKEEADELNEVKSNIKIDLPNDSEDTISIVSVNDDEEENFLALKFEDDASPLTPPSDAVATEKVIAGNLEHLNFESVKAKQNVVAVEDAVVVTRVVNEPLRTTARVDQPNVYKQEPTQLASDLMISHVQSVEACDQSTMCYEDDEDDLLTLCQLDEHSEQTQFHCNQYIIFVCPHCGVNFNTNAAWREHIAVTHSRNDAIQFHFSEISNNKFQCNKCKLFLTRCTEKTLQQHSYTHLPFKMYKCKLCVYEARSVYLMISHIMMHKDREQLSNMSTSAQIGASFDHECSVFIAFKCAVCGLIFESEDVWQAHMNFEHNFLQKIAENRFENHFKCTECNLEIYSQQVCDLQQHLFKHFPFKSVYQCKLCHWTIPTRSFMLSHIINLHKDHLAKSTNLAPMPTTSSMLNSTAPAQLPNSAAYKYEHITRIPFIRKRALSLDAEDTSPVSNAADITLPTRDDIVRRFPLSEPHKRKRRVNCKDKPFKLPYKRGYSCTGCELTFRTPVERNEHNVATHAKYTCNVCTKNFALKAEFTLHSCLPKNDLPLQCEICFKEFKYERVYLGHIRMCKNRLQARPQFRP